jgi:hypothetical protein
MRHRLSVISKGTGRYLKMRTPSRAVLTALFFVACGAKKTAEQRATDLETCTALSTAPLEIAQCLQGRGGWSEAAADSAANQRARELDSVRSQIGAITAQADSQHAAEIHSCDQRLVDLKTCLITRYGWDENQATAIDDSIWNSRAPEHLSQIRNCSGRRGVGTGACLQLYYKWLPRRALALDDSIRRANIN